MNKKHLFTAILAVTGGVFASHASISLVTSRGALGETDYKEWLTLGSVNTVLGSPINTTTFGGDGLKISDGINFTLMQQAVSWGGNFTSGDGLLWTGGNGAITIDPASLIGGAGFQIQADYYGGFGARIEAFDSSAASLGFVTEAGNSTGNNDGSAIFIGFQSSGVDVDYFVVSLDYASNEPGDFAINRLSLVGTSPVPEASGTGLVAGLSMLGLGAARLRRARTKQA